MLSEHDAGHPDQRQGMRHRASNQTAPPAHRNIEKNDSTTAVFGLLARRIICRSGDGASASFPSPASSSGWLAGIAAEHAGFQLQQARPTLSPGQHAIGQCMLGGRRMRRRQQGRSALSGPPRTRRCTLTPSLLCRPVALSSRRCQAPASGDRVEFRAPAPGCFLALVL